MSNQKHHEMMIKLDKCYSIVLQNGKKGISADEIAGKLNIHRTTAYDRLNRLELMGKIENKHGIWYAKTGEQTIKPLEREIVIELPIPKDQAISIGLLEILAKECEEKSLPKTANIYRTILQTLRETRTIKVKGKNIDNLNLEKLGALIQQANKKSSRINLKGLFKGLKRQPPSKLNTDVPPEDAS